VTNDSATVSDATTDTKTDDAVSDDATQPHQPHIQILKGQPTDAELAALLTVLASVGGAPEPQEPEKTRWGLPVDGLRFAMSNYQRLTMQQMTHLRK
jgi:hypothetical protein